MLPILGVFASLLRPRKSVKDKIVCPNCKSQRIENITKNSRTQYTCKDCGHEGYIDKNEKPVKKEKMSVGLKIAITTVFILLIVILIVVVEVTKS